MILPKRINKYFLILPNGIYKYFLILPNGICKYLLILPNGIYKYFLFYQMEITKWELTFLLRALHTQGHSRILWTFPENLNLKLRIADHWEIFFHRIKFYCLEKYVDCRLFQPRRREQFCSKIDILVEANLWWTSWFISMTSKFNQTANTF